MPSPSSAINEFTGVAGIAPVVDGGGSNSPARRRRRLLTRKKSAVSEFVEGVAGDDLEKKTPAATTGPTVPPAAPAEPAPTAVTAPTPPVTPNEAAKSALMITKEVAEALVRGHAVTVRGVLLEPAFSPSTAHPLSESTTSVPSVEAAVATFGLSAPEPGSVVESAGAVDMNAPQPPPTPPSDGRAVSSAFRRFAR